MHLARIAEPRGDQHRPVGRLPTQERRRAVLEIRTGPRHELAWDVGHAVGNERGRLFGRVRFRVGVRSCLRNARAGGNDAENERERAESHPASHSAPSRRLAQVRADCAPSPVNRS